MSACPRAVRPDPPGGEQHVTVVSAASGQAHTFAERARAVERSGELAALRTDPGVSTVATAELRVWDPYGSTGQEAAGGRAFSGPVCCSAAAGKLDA
jgi:hypothetical protein